jgi:type IV pilus assembly protein PilE
MARKDGFTLLELLVVLAIVAILAAIAVPRYSNYKPGSLDAQAKSDLHNMANAMEGYFGSTGNYAGASVPADLTAFGYRQSANVNATGGGTSTGYTLQATPLGGSATWSFDSSDGAIVTVGS